MDKIDVTKQFAARLRDTMIAEGYDSKRSTSGVNIHKLAEITGHSLQICRKYLRGQVIPEPIKLIEIALRLRVSPGWLLFGDQSNLSNTKRTITIRETLLHYIFTQAALLYRTDRSHDEISDFLLDLTHNISQINANEAQSKQIIDLALASARHFKDSTT